MAVLFIGSAAFSQKSKISLTKGQTFNVESKMSTTAITEVQGQEMKTEIDSKSDYKIEVAEVNNGNFKLKSTITSMKLKTEQMGQELSYNSEDSNNANNPMAIGMEEILNHPFSVTVDASGNVVDVDSVNSNNASLVQLQQAGFGTDVLFQQIPVNVKVGDKWSDSSSTPELVRTTEYTVKSISGNMVTLGMTGKLKTSTTMDMNGMEIHTKTEGTFTGEAVVDKKTGLVHSSKTESDSKGTVNAMGQEFPMTSKTESKSEVK